jgi:hypothetical protein
MALWLFVAPLCSFVVSCFEYYNNQGSCYTESHREVTEFHKDLWGNFLKNFSYSSLELMLVKMLGSFTETWIWS